MKKLVSVLFAVIAALCILSGCSMSRAAYSEQEKQMIVAANQLISSEYSVSALKTDIHEKGEVYAYSVTFHSKTNDILDISVSIGE